MEHIQMIVSTKSCSPEACFAGNAFLYEVVMRPYHAASNHVGIRWRLQNLADALVLESDSC
jgi:hypothetical protein